MAAPRSPGGRGGQRRPTGTSITSPGRVPPGRGSAGNGQVGLIGTAPRMSGAPKQLARSEGSAIRRNGDPTKIRKSAQKTASRSLRKVEKSYGVKGGKVTSSGKLNLKGVAKGERKLVRQATKLALGRNVSGKTTQKAKGQGRAGGSKKRG